MHKDSFASIPAIDLEGVTGGMQWDSFPRSGNIEDARGMNMRQASQAFPGGGGAEQPGGGGALGNQLGLDRVGQSPVNAGGGGGGGW